MEDNARQPWGSDDERIEKRFLCGGHLISSHLTWVRSKPWPQAIWAFPEMGVPVNHPF